MNFPADAKVKMKIYDIIGSPVRTIDLGYKQAGLYLDKANTGYWDGKNDDGEKVASGVYFYAIYAGEHHAVRRLILVK